MKFFLFSAFSLFLCSCTFLASATNDCFFIEDGSTTLILDQSGPQGLAQITLQSPNEEDLLILGEMRDGYFVYADGITEFHFDEEKAWYTNEPFLAGIEATRISCK